MYIISKQFREKFKKLDTKSMIDIKKDNEEYNGLVKVLEEYKRDKKNQLRIF